MRFIRPLLAALALAFAAPSFAQDSVPAPTNLVCFGSSGVYCVHPDVAFSGTAYDLTTHSVVRSFQASGLLELSLPKGFGIAGGVGYETGDVAGFHAIELLTFPVYSLAAGASQVFTGSTHSVALVVGSVIRF